ncbi:MAG: M56 family peptidase [Alistipes sp.]|nr:M56 family peptidase [Alistipes sp.]
MYALLTYSLKAGACLAVFYLFFKLLLSRETFHRFNRFVVLAGMLLAFVLPLCVVTVYRELPSLPETVVREDAELPVVLQEEEEAPFDWRPLLGALFAAGAAGMLLRTLGALAGVVRTVRSGRRERLDDGSVLVRVPGDAAPFSWWRYIVVSENDMAAAGREILCHEQAHLRLRHSADLLAADLAGCLQWFNPAMWLLRRELRAIHEYEADRAVIESGADARDYQLLLIRKAVGGRWYSVANSFNHSKLKNRITMMLREKSSRWAGARALFLLPLTAVALGAFAETAYVVPDDKVNKEFVAANVSGPNISLTGLDGDPLVLVDGKETTLTEVPGHRVASMQIIKGERAVETYGEKARNGTVLITLKKDGDASADAAAPRTDSIAVIGYGTFEKPVKAAPLYVVDGEETTSLDGIEPERIATIEVLKDPDALTVYGDKGRNGVVVITLKKEGAVKADRRSVKIDDATIVVGGSSDEARAGAPKTVVIVDGVQVDGIDRVPSDEVESVTVLKRSLPEKYKEQGYDNMVVVTTKRLAQADSYFRSDEWKEVQRQLAGKTSYFESDEWKAAQKRIEEAGQKAAEIGARLESGRLSVTSGDSSWELGEDGEMHAEGHVSVTGTSGIPDDCLIFINGKRATKAEMEKIPAGKIRRMSVYKGEAAVRKFGPAAAAGAVDIKARKY